MVNTSCMTNLSSRICCHAVTLDTKTSVFEIGCGEGFLTRRILHTPVARVLWVFEIDADWATHVRNTLKDNRLPVFEENFLGSDLNQLEPHAPWTILANLPYQVTFPILHRFVKKIQAPYCHRRCGYGSRRGCAKNHRKKWAWLWICITLFSMAF